MIPLRDVIPSRTTPWAAIAVLGGYVVGAAVGVLPHPGWWAILANGLPLWIFGETLEDRLGHGRFLSFLAIGAGAATAAAAWVAPDTPAALGVFTGAAAATIGGYFALFRRSRVLVLVYAVVIAEAVEVPALMIVATWVVLHAVALDPMESVYLARPLLAAELGGLATGAATVWAFRRRERMQPEWWNQIAD
jgi:membrane associated rhomboid family serine protease